MLKAKPFFLLCISTLLALFSLQTAIAGTPEIFTSRGIVHIPNYRAQQNTLDAFMGIVQWNKDHPENKISGAEMHVVVVKPQNPGDAPIFVCDHDEDLIDLTGQNINIHNLSLQQIKSLQLKQILDGVDYGRTRSFSFFPDMLDAFMKDPVPFKIWLNIKDKDYYPTLGKIGYTSTELIKALKNWREWYRKNRNVDIFNYIMISSDNPFIGGELSQLSRNEGLDKQGLVIFPNYLDMSLSMTAWKIFMAMGGYENLFKMNSDWVGLQESFLSSDVIQKYHNQGKKILGWGFNPDSPYFNQVDAALVSD